MNGWQVFVAVMQVLGPIIKLWLERDAAKKKDQQEKIDAVVTAISSRDASAVNLAFNTLRSGGVRK